MMVELTVELRKFHPWFHPGFPRPQVVSLMIYQFTMMVEFALKLAPAQTVLVGALVIPATYSYMRVLDQRYDTARSPTHARASSAAAHIGLPCLPRGVKYKW